MATIELIGSPADGTSNPSGHLHAVEVDNQNLAANGYGFLGHTADITVTGSDRVVTIPAGTYIVPDGSGGTVIVTKASSTNVTIAAADATNPRTDIVHIDAAGNIGKTDGTATEESGDVEEAPMKPLASDELLLAKVRAEANTANIGTDKVVGRAIDVSEVFGLVEGPMVPTLVGFSGTMGTQAMATNTTMRVGLLIFPHAMSISSFTLDVTAAGTPGTLDVALFSNDGQTQFFDQVTGSIAGTGLDTTTLSAAVVVPAGLHYVAIVPNSTANITLTTWGDWQQGAAPAGGNEVAGDVTVSAGVIPATFDPDAGVTHSNAVGAQIRFD